MMKKNRIILYILSFCITVVHNLYSQQSMYDLLDFRPSVKIFNCNTSPLDSLNDINIPNYDLKYFYKNSPCYRYIFRPKNIVEDENSCPICYTLSGQIGTYYYVDTNTIDIISDSLYVYHKFVDHITSTANNEDQLEFNIFNKNEDKIGNILTIYYIKGSKLFNTTKSLSLRHDDINSLVGHKVYIERICIEVYQGEKRKIYFIPINKSIKLEANSYNVYLRTNGIRIQKIRDKIYIFNWDHLDQKYKKADELVYKMG